MKYITLLVVAAFISAASVAQTNQVMPAQPRSMPVANSQSAAKGEKHPNIVAAQKALENAKEHLQKAPHDFGGHRTKAVESINMALSELKEALQVPNSIRMSPRNDFRGLHRLLSDYADYQRNDLIICSPEDESVLWRM